MCAAERLNPGNAIAALEALQSALSTVLKGMCAQRILERVPKISAITPEGETEVDDNGLHFFCWNYLKVEFNDGKCIVLKDEGMGDGGEFLDDPYVAADVFGYPNEVDQPDGELQVMACAFGIPAEVAQAIYCELWGLVYLLGESVAYTATFIEALVLAAREGGTEDQRGIAPM